jgi:cation diffusion facilitator family transporter
VISILAAVGLIAIKLIAGVLTNSLALYSEAGHSAIDLMAAVVTYIAVKKGSKPPDREHHFGHAKYESVGALAQLVILVVLVGGIVYSAIQRLSVAPPELNIGWIAFVVMGISISIEGWRTFSLLHAARKTGSEALAANFTHFLSDFLDSFVVLFGLFMASLGYPKADSFAALFVAAVILSVAIRLGFQVFHSLTDRAPEGLAREVEGIVLAVKHVIGVHDIRIRQAGSQLFTEMHVELDHEFPLAKVHDILDEIEAALRHRYPAMHVSTHPEPGQRARSN